MDNGREKSNCKGGPVKSWVRLRVGAKLARTAFVVIGYQLFTVKTEKGIYDSSGKKDKIFWFHSWFPISSDNLDNELGTVLQMLMMSLIWEELQIFRKNMTAVLVASWPWLNIAMLLKKTPNPSLHPQIKKQNKTKPKPHILLLRSLWHFSHFSSSNKALTAVLCPILATPVQETYGPVADNTEYSNKNDGNCCL